jgi:DNA invertase Pin-like site-specific DNA recombinase
MNLDHDPHQKVTTEHLKRNACLYIRQSSLQQVFHNTESTQRQYALKQRAIALGWPAEQVVVIDTDQGISGASAADREGFQKLVTEVSLGRAGIVLGLEVSRLARNCSDWHRLLEICALANTLILDEDGLYDPADFNDRLLLGLKGTMSEAELHVLRARLQGGIRNKARRGELRMPLPVGLAYDAQGKVILHPDRQVRQTFEVFFALYERLGSALGVVRHFAQHHLLFPRRVRGGPQRGELVWGPLIHTHALQVLRNPRYAGAFVFGRTRTCRRAHGQPGYVHLAQDQWHTLLPGVHPGYITWEQYQDHLRTLHACAQARGRERRQSPPGQGPALLQGLVVCGVCGRRMTLRYHTRHGRQVADYMCQQDSTQRSAPVCQHVQGAGIDAALGELLLAMMQPVTLELAFAVQAELQTRLEEVDRLRRQQVQRAEYEADLARTRFMQVDPKNRLVADALEADWNGKLRLLAEAQEQYQQQRQQDQMVLDEQSRQRVLALAQDLPRLWRDPATSDQDRKRMVRLLIEDVTLTKAQRIKVQVRFKGGATRTLDLPVPPTAWQKRQTDSAVVRTIDTLLDVHDQAAVAAELNARGLRSGMGQVFTAGLVWKICRAYHLRSRYERLRQQGLHTAEEMAAELGVTRHTVIVWGRCGLLQGHAYTRKGERLYELPPPGLRPKKQQGLWGKLTARAQYAPLHPHAANEVQYEA